MRNNGKSRSRRRKRSTSPRRRAFAFLIVPAILLVFIWILLVRRVSIDNKSMSDVSPERLLPMPLVVERHGDEENNVRDKNDREHNVEVKITDSKKQHVPLNDKVLKKSKKQKYIVEAVDEEDAQKDETKTSSRAIPNVITFTHSTNLLNTTIKVTGEDVALQRNVRNTIKLHPGATIHFLTDDECIASIQRVLGKDSPLVDFFKSETHGMYKADICRGASLYETGGLYFDVDIQARSSLWDAIPPKTTFVTPMVHRQSKYPRAFFQAFIGVTPQNPIILRYLELFVKHYQGHIDVQGPLGVLLLRRAHDEIMHDGDAKLQQHVELWQEVLYNKQLFPHVPPPSWGTRRACHFVVVANRSRPFVVPLYSRVQGSRMCGGKESVKNLRGG